MIKISKFKKQICIGFTQDEIGKKFKLKCPFCQRIYYAEIESGRLWGRTRIKFFSSSLSKCPTSFCQRTTFVVKMKPLDIVRGKIDTRILYNGKDKTSG